MRAIVAGLLAVAFSAGGDGALGRCGRKPRIDQPDPANLLD